MGTSCFADSIFSLTACQPHLVAACEGLWLEQSARGAVAKPVYLCARAAQIGRSPRSHSVPPGRAQREPQGYAGLTTCAHGPSRAAFSMLPAPYVTEANERTTGWITLVVLPLYWVRFGPRPYEQPIHIMDA